MKVKFDRSVHEALFVSSLSIYLVKPSLSSFGDPERPVSVTLNSNLTSEHDGLSIIRALMRCKDENR